MIHQHRADVLLLPTSCCSSDEEPPCGYAQPPLPTNESAGLIPTEFIRHRRRYSCWYPSLISYLTKANLRNVLYEGNICRAAIISLNRSPAVLEQS